MNCLRGESFLSVFKPLSEQHFKESESYFIVIFDLLFLLN